MKTATVRDLRNHYTGLLDWIAAGEEIVITRRGHAIARLIPEPANARKTTDWRTSPVMLRDRSDLQVPSSQELSDLLKESAGKW